MDKINGLWEQVSHIFGEEFPANSNKSFLDNVREHRNKLAAILVEDIQTAPTHEILSIIHPILRDLTIAHQYIAQRQALMDAVVRTLNKRGLDVNPTIIQLQKDMTGKELQKLIKDSTDLTPFVIGKEEGNPNYTDDWVTGD